MRVQRGPCVLGIPICELLLPEVPTAPVDVPNALQNWGGRSTWPPKKGRQKGTDSDFGPRASPPETGAAPRQNGCSGKGRNSQNSRKRNTDSTP